MSLEHGARLGPYEIVSLLGVGGMGEVYRATDSNLKRSVAIKVLPASVAGDEDRLVRFQREAEVLGALNHPNVAAIYGLERSGDMIALVMELVEGDDLSQRIARGAMPIDEVLPIAKQIADALEAAHEQGIIHRDLKPANIKVRADGTAKILDFGLAKAADPMAMSSQDTMNSPTVATPAMTRAGVILGTAPYMSPEQARGKPIDKRTDIWAFGCVLYEMLTGRMAFPGATLSDHIAAILEREPNWTALPVAMPPSLRRLLRQCLEKDPKRRLHDIADARIDLEEALACRRGGSVTIKRTPVVLSVAGLVVAVTVGYFAMRGPLADRAVARLSNPVQFAATVGFETLPAWSPDGRTIAYQSDQTGNTDIWLAQRGGAAVNRTADFPGGDEAPRWSPDGTQIAFWSAREGGGIFVMPALGGSARKIGPARPDVAASAAWSPDGTELVYPVVGSVAQDRPRLEVRNIKTGAVRTISLSPAAGGRPPGCLDLTWSPDGRFLAFLQANSYNNQTGRIWTLRLQDEVFTLITNSESVNWSPRWFPDSRTLLFTSDRGGAMDIWQQHLTAVGERAGEAERVTTGLDVLQIAITPDGRRLAYAKGKRLANVWRVPIVDDRLATWADVHQVTFDQAWVEAIDVSPDGQRLAIQSDRSGNADIWTLPAGGGDMQQLTTDPAPDWWPTWSPDGREIAFYSNRVGDREAWVQPVVDGPARQITHGGGIFPRWSHDGKSLFFGNNGIAVVSLDGGAPRTILKTEPALGYGTMEFTLAPDGASFAFASGRAPDRRIWRASVTTGDTQPLTKGQADAPSWSRDGRWVYFTTYRDSPGTVYQLERPGLNIWRVSSDGAKEQPMTQLSGRRGWLGQNIANDGLYLYFTWREDVADIWTMDIGR